MAKLNSPLAKFLGVILAVLGIAVYSSWTTKKNITDSIQDYSRYAFKESVIAAINETGLPEQSKENNQMLKILVEDNYQETIKQVNKDYEKIGKGDLGDLTKTNLDRLATTWKQLPDEYKTDTLKTKYDYVMSFYSKI